MKVKLLQVKDKSRMPKKTRRNKKSKRRRKQKIMGKEEENIILNRNPAPEDIDKLIDKLNAHGEASTGLKKFLVYVMERQAYGPELSDEFTFFCLSSYFILKNNYENISERYELPPKSFLMEEVFKNFKFMPGITDIVLELFKVKTEHCKPDSKICVLLIDEHVLNPGVTYFEKYGNIGYDDVGNELAYIVTTIWICPVNVKCTIPLAYYFTHEPYPAAVLKHYLFEAITKLDDIGIEVIGVAAKVKRNLLKLSQNLNISVANQSFKVGNKNVVFLFDVHHLINITRNNFMTYKFIYEEIRTSPRDVGNFFFTEWQFSPKTTITKSHLVPDREQSTCLKYATELLSNNVSSTMMSYISAGLMPKAATGTARCIDMFDKLFRIMNSVRINFGNQLDSGYCGSKLQVEFMQKMIHFFENLRVYDHLDNDRTDQLIFKKAWIISIKGMMQLWEVMKQKNYPHLLTNHINFEFIDLFERSLRFQEDSYNDPTPWKFLGLYEMAFVTHYFLYWPHEYSSDDGEFDIDEDYAKKVFKRIPDVSHDLTGKTKVEKIFYPDIKNSARYFIDFVESWADHCDYIDQLFDDQQV